MYRYKRLVSVLAGVAALAGVMSVALPAAQASVINNVSIGGGSYYAGGYGGWYMPPMYSYYYQPYTYFYQPYYSYPYYSYSYPYYSYGYGYGYSYDYGGYGCGCSYY